MHHGWTKQPLTFLPQPNASVLVGVSSEVTDEARLSAYVDTTKNTYQGTFETFGDLVRWLDDHDLLTAFAVPDAVVALVRHQDEDADHPQE